MSLRALAQRTGFSASFLSQVELSQCSPSLSSLQRICDGLELELPELLRSKSAAVPASPVVRRKDRAALRSGWSRASAESLLPKGAAGGLSAMLLTLDPGGRTGALPRRPDVREFAYCVRGRIVLVVGEVRHELRAGDSALLDRGPVAWENPGRTRAEILLVSARGS